MKTEVSVSSQSMDQASTTSVSLRCVNEKCAASVPASHPANACSSCGSLFDVHYDWPSVDAASLKKLWLERKMSRDARDLSGVWRFREILPFLGTDPSVVTLREGNTPLIESSRSGAYAGIDAVTFKHQGFNPTGSFKDNGMTTGVSQAASLGKRLVACVSTGNTSASLAAYAAYGGLRAVIFIPSGQIAGGKLAQSLEYGALTIQVDGNFDETWKVIAHVVDRAGIHLLNSVNPYRIEGQKTIVVEMMEQLNWEPPDWIVLPGGNLGNTSAFGKGLREMYALGLIPHLPRMGVIQADGAAPLYNLLQKAEAENRNPMDIGIAPVADPHTLATAIKIGAPASWQKALREIAATQGICETVNEQEIADAKAVIGQSGIGCEPASAATLAGIKKLSARGIIKKQDRVVAVLTGNVLKDPAYTLSYHQGTLVFPHDGKEQPIESNFGNRPVAVAADADAILRVIEKGAK